MRWLLVARKRLDEAGLARFRLVCGCAERLPIHDQSVGTMIAGDVIEHVRSQTEALAEAHRILVPGGRIFLASPNRYSLAPEPHVQVWGVGFLPRGWMTAYVRFWSGVDFRAIRTLGLREWRRLLRESPFRGGDLWAPGLPREDLVQFGPVKRTVARVYNRLLSVRPGQAMAKRFGPLFHVVCQRAEPRDPSTSPATPLRSRRPVAAG
jgi:SAM-dependent methyltransferase